MLGEQLLIPLGFKWQTIDYFNLSTFGSFGGLEWSNVESRFNEEVVDETQNFGKGEYDKLDWCHSIRSLDEKLIQ